MIVIKDGLPEGIILRLYYNYILHYFGAIDVKFGSQEEVMISTAQRGLLTNFFLYL